MRKTPVSVKVDLAVQHRAYFRIGRDGGNKAGKLGTMESLSNLTGKSLVRRVLLLAQIEAGEFASPGDFFEAVESGPASLGELSVQSVLLDEQSEALIKAGVAWIAVDLSPVKRNCIRKAVRLREARKITIENASIII